ncbi:hypothetical protein TcasGA2_TC011693 [Tribolium castaneum]|uniref:Uncharacterized protein n=1 Tax=Tribolium castaneum TaxID=7070 RepID=D6X0F9_TRICA|nr:hypothetical protein TcasGA2_TC011693 [Tribolium castaneum]
MAFPSKVRMADSKPARFAQLAKLKPDFRPKRLGKITNLLSSRKIQIRVVIFAKIVPESKNSARDVTEFGRMRVRAN